MVYQNTTSNSRYGAHRNVAKKFLDNPIFGVGIKNLN